MTVDPTIVRLAELDASRDELLSRFDGARSAFIRRLVLAEIHFDVYRDSYERAMERFCASRRARNVLHIAGAL